MDGGIRSGQDILTALAVGAKAVMIGRPVLYGLGAGGEQGVVTALNILRRELDFTTAMCSKADITKVGRDVRAVSPYT